MSKLIQCKSCNAQIAKNAKACPHCGAKNKKPIYKKWWVWVLVGILLLIIVSAAGGGDDSSSSGNASTKETKAETATEAPTTKIGDVLTTDKFEITVESVETRTKVGGQYFDSTPSEGGIYVVINWNYKNISDSPISSWSCPSLHIKDANGTEYDADIGATSSFATEIDLDRKVLSDLNPGISVKDAEVFEVSEELYQAGGFSVFVDADKDFTLPLE